MNKKYLTAAVCASLAMVMNTVNAALLWSADFSTYDTGDGAAELVLNNSGADDTFSSMSFNRLTDTSLEVRGSGVPSFMSGNALYQGGVGTGESGTASGRLFLASLETMGSSGVRVISFDLARSSDRGFSLQNEARTSSGRSGDTVYTAVSNTSSALRVTIVINRTGSEITLPGSLGTLSNNSLVSYHYDGESFSGAAYSSGNVTSNNIAGFGTGIGVSNLNEGVEIATWYDNFGVWDDLGDTVGGTNVLQLTPGTVIPEPSSAAMLIPALVLTVMLLRRRSSEKKA